MASCSSDCCFNFRQVWVVIDPEPRHEDLGVKPQAPGRGGYVPRPRVAVWDHCPGCFLKVLPLLPAVAYAQVGSELLMPGLSSKVASVPGKGYQRFPLHPCVGVGVLVTWIPWVSQFLSDTFYILLFVLISVLLFPHSIRSGCSESMGGVHFPPDASSIQLWSDHLVAKKAFSKAIREIGKYQKAKEQTRKLQFYSGTG